MGGMEKIMSVGKHREEWRALRGQAGGEVLVALSYVTTGGHTDPYQQRGLGDTCSLDLL